MSESRPLSDTDLELLSAYADGALSDSERQQLEARLHIEPALQAELDELRETIRLIKTLPPLRAPRSYTLTREMAGLSNVVTRRSRPFTVTTTFSAISAAAAVFLVVFGVGLLMSNRSGAPAALLQDVAMLSTQTLPNTLGGIVQGTFTGESEVEPLNDVLDAASAEMQVIPTIEVEMDEETSAPETLFFAPAPVVGTAMIMPTMDANTARTMEDDSASSSTGGGAANAADAAGAGVAQPETVNPPLMAVPADPLASEFTPTATKTPIILLTTPTSIPTQAALAQMTHLPPTSTPIIAPTQRVDDLLTTSAPADTTSLIGIVLIAGGVILLGASAFSIILRRSRRARGE